MSRHLLRILLCLLLLTAGVCAQRLSPLAAAPDWAALEPFQQTITREEFLRLLEEVYAPGGASRPFISVEADRAVVLTTLQPPASWTLRFATTARELKAAPRFWHTPAELPPLKPGKPLQGVKIALDAGHLGGAWARMEERWFQIGDAKPVTEGDMTLAVAALIAPQLRALGAEVSLVREAVGPTTDARPETLRQAARDDLARRGVVSPREDYAGPDDPNRAGTVQVESEILFYRISEIRHRAQVVNQQLRPDLTLCLHFNAEAWGDPLKPDFVDANHLHVLVNGSYLEGELRNDDVRFDMLNKLLSRCFEQEVAASDNVAAALARATRLPAYEYPANNARPVSQSAYVWARNLLANRLYQSPVVFLEPYVMNHREVWERIQTGDYPGQRLVAGAMRKSIFREYADAAVEGVCDYYRAARH